VAIDAIRCAKLALDRRIGGPLVEISACAMKHPPHQMRDTDAKRALETWIHGA
jgi:myo-inositol-1-phosphate synthase